MSSKAHIYTLRHPDTREIKYIGCSIDPKRRYYEHSSAHGYKKGSRTPIDLWLNTLLISGKKPLMEIIDECARKDKSSVEKHWVQKYRKTHAILNIFDGCSHTEETKAWVSKGNSKRKLSEETKAKIGQKNKKYSFYIDHNPSQREFVDSISDLSSKTGIPISTISYRIKNLIPIGDNIGFRRINL